MKHLKKIVAAVVLGFFAFAPPGTLIFIGVLALSLFGKTWLMIGVFGGLIVFGCYAFVNRKKIQELSFVKKTLERFKKIN